MVGCYAASGWAFMAQIYGQNGLGVTYGYKKTLFGLAVLEIAHHIKNNPPPQKKISKPADGRG